MKSTCFRALVVVLGLLVSSPTRAFVDYDGDGYDDVWQRLYNVTLAEFPLNEDFDHDGCTNLTESMAGTDPRNPNDCIRVGNVLIAGTNVVLSVVTETGKKYQIQGSTTPSGGTWNDEGSAITGDGSTLQFVTPTGGAERKFYRIKTSDQDSDGDGVSDWEEHVLGTDPAVAKSSTNASGGVVNDGLALQALLSLTSCVVTPDAFEKSASPAVVRLSRPTALASFPLTVSITKSGDANVTKGSASATDYALIDTSNNLIAGNTITIPAGVTDFDVRITPVSDAITEVPETLILGFGDSSAPITTQAVKIRDAENTDANQRLFVAYLGREAGVATTASGVATIQLLGDNSAALVNLTFNNLTSEQNTAYLRIDNGREVQPLPKGQVVGASWQIRAAQTRLTDQAMLDALFRGDLYISVSTAANLAGEIRGNFQLANGSVSDPPTPADPPAYGTAEFPNLAASGVSNNLELDRDIVRFLTQATFGATSDSIQEVRDLIAANGNDAIAGYTAWIDKQQDLAQTPSPSFLQLVQAADTEEFILRGSKPSAANGDPQFGTQGRTWNAATRTFDLSTIKVNNEPNAGNRRREWWTLALQSRDQLRQRTAWALNQILVISDDNTTLNNFHYGMANYWDQLASGAFGSYRTLLENVTYSPMMGVYLSHLKNQRELGQIKPDENYAREIIQLFSIGLVLRHSDGSLKLGLDGLPIATYDQNDITELARVMTGFSFSKVHTGGTGALVNNTDFYAGNGNLYWQGSWLNPMKLFATDGTNEVHDFDQKTLFAGKVAERVIPARTTKNATNATLDVTQALNTLAGNPTAGSYNGHPNTPVFVSRLLIQRFTTSNPSSGYLYRVATKFKDTKGDLGQVVKAILLDREARTLSIADDVVGHGKPKEPLLHFTALLRALKAHTNAPLANLNTMPVTFTSAQSSVTTPYASSELAKFPAGATRFRFPDVSGNLGQSPLSAPSVFNFFLPDYIAPGPISAAGLVAPELQIATESNVISTINYLQSVIFAGANGKGLNDFPNLSQYAKNDGTQLQVPSYGITAGYFTATKFDPSLSGSAPDDIDANTTSLFPVFDELTTLYTSSYTAAIPVGTPTPTNAQKTAAHLAALTAVVDRTDLWFAAGVLKARYASASGTTPRSAIIDIVRTIANNNYHTTDAGFAADALTRVQNIVYLVATSPEALVLK